MNAPRICWSNVVFAALVFAAGLAGPFTARAQDTGTEQPPIISAGQQLVELYCADCHATGPTGEGKHPTAPRFRDLHLRYNVLYLEEALVEGLVAHPDMPEFEFDTDQAIAIIDYLDSLQPHPEDSSAD